jgi:hypothetical protein
MNDDLAMFQILRPLNRLLLPALLGLLSLQGLCTTGRAGKISKDWPEGKTYSLKGLDVDISAPVLVGRSHGYFWQPIVVRLSDGNLLAVIWNLADQIYVDNTALFSWSGDGGLTWSRPTEGEVSDIGLTLPSGDELLLPFNLRALSNTDLEGNYQVVPRGRRQIKLVKKELTVSGWPRPPGWGPNASEQSQRAKGLSSWVFYGQSVPLKRGAYLATMYGTFQGDATATDVLVQSTDGVHWKFCSIIAGPHNCREILKGAPFAKLVSEPSLCRLADGRLLSIFRLQYHQTGFPCGETWSTDEGKTWSKPIVMANAFPVSPSLAVMKNGVIVLSGGRPGLYAWFNVDGTGKTWQRIDVMAHHDALAGDDPMHEVFDKDAHHPLATLRTSAYTTVVALDDTHVIYIYDRIPNGWYPIPNGSAATNSVWVVRMTLRKK